MGLQGWWPGFSEAFLTMQMAVLMGWEESRWRDGAILVFWLGKENNSPKSCFEFVAKNSKDLRNLWSRTCPSGVHPTFSFLAFYNQTQFAAQGSAPQMFRPLQNMLAKSPGCSRVPVWPLLLTDVNTAWWLPLLLCAQGSVPAHGDGASVGKQTVPCPV